MLSVRRSDARVDSGLASYTDNPYSYRLIRSFFVQTKHWKYYDPFLSQKEATFQKSSRAIYRESHCQNACVSPTLINIFHVELATTMHELERDNDTLASDPDNLKVIFKEMIQMCLWYVSGRAPLSDCYSHIV